MMQKMHQQHLLMPLLKKQPSNLLLNVKRALNVKCAFFILKIHLKIAA